MYPQCACAAVLSVMPVQAGFAHSAVASSLFPSCFPSPDADTQLVALSDSLHAAESLQPYHIDCELTQLPLCHCDAASLDSRLTPLLWASAVRRSIAAIADLLDEQHRPDKHKL